MQITYLEYAEHAVDSLLRSIVEAQGNCESPIEEEVATALIRMAVSRFRKSAVEGFRVDLALKHPFCDSDNCLTM